MSEALKLAQIAGDAGEVPVGCIIVNSQGDLIGQGENRKQRDQDPTAHAEIVAIRSAARTLQNWHLDQCTLYVTLEPCPMCAGAIIHARLQTLVYAVDDPKTGAIRTVINIPSSPASNHRLRIIGGILESASRQQLQSWFVYQRSQKTQKSGYGSNGNELSTEEIR
ncbi:tRNA-specific adenosine deaminase [Cylindrospermopsis raciborskii CENA303]|uniref:tRNA-specific adenosine deaminase n=1 Tax=Cylindrospermopsis raciborskii CENA303 TaxID=1170769 RepID=A0A1X4G466_9CYAN|nr:tRNA adenosine(34) deaminase TadA [Cylindrospermopsis raciborskii]OSO89260.1 tRNA-specific adenosine deaminase [Cylindrospermopsis raciborskii CENA303]